MCTKKNCKDTVCRTVIITRRYAAPCGNMLLGDCNGKLCLAIWLAPQQPACVAERVCRRLHAEMRDGSSPLLDQAELQLDQYFAGIRHTFSIPLLPAGTDFQLRVWQQLQAIPYGATITYGEQARLMGCGRAVRAVAHANGHNALSVFIPCHRVTGAGGRLSGYAGGPEAKQMLIRLEQDHGHG